MDDAAPDDDLRRHLEHLQVERRLADRTLAMYREAFGRLQTFATATDVALRRVQVHHVRRWAAQLHGQGLAPGSIAMIPLRDGTSPIAFGLLVLASPDPTRYTADMGTEFLNRIGEIASAALSRLLPAN